MKDVAPTKVSKRIMDECKFHRVSSNCRSSKSSSQSCISEQKFPPPCRFSTAFRAEIEDTMGERASRNQYRRSHMNSILVYIAFLWVHYDVDDNDTMIKMHPSHFGEINLSVPFFFLSLFCIYISQWHLPHSLFGVSRWQRQVVQRNAAGNRKIRKNETCLPKTSERSSLQCY